MFLFTKLFEKDSEINNPLHSSESKHSQTSGVTESFTDAGKSVGEQILKPD